MKPGPGGVLLKKGVTADGHGGNNHAFRGGRPRSGLTQKSCHPSQFEQSFPNAVRRVEGGDAINVTF
jgi:hypothetical protein